MSTPTRDDAAAPLPRVTEAEKGSTRRVIDVHNLPKTVYGMRNLASWATVAFIVIEGTTLVVLLVAYFYLQRNFPQWPPPPTQLPSLLVPTLNTLLLLAVIVPMTIVERAARKHDLVRVRKGLLTAVAMSAGVAGLRILDFEAVNTRWDSHAYGSVVWVIVGLHTTLLIIDLVETAAMAALTHSERLQDKHYSDFEDAALYQYFLSGMWVPIYLVVFLGPRFT